MGAIWTIRTTDVAFFLITWADAEADIGKANRSLAMRREIFVDDDKILVALFPLAYTLKQ